MAVRYHTRLIAIIHSHQSESPIDVSQDVVSFRSSKAIRGVGNFSLTVVPRKNYFNHIYPNDVINVYIDPGDGKRGFIRTVMGYVDRIERTEKTSQDTGAVSTMFTIYCSDFQKIVEKTDVYFNPHLRTPIDSRFGTNLLGDGTIVRRNGIVGYGTPADFASDLLITWLGYGHQWVLPESYPTNYAALNVERRKQRAKSRIPQELLDIIKTQYGFNTVEAAAENADNIIARAGRSLNELAKFPSGAGVASARAVLGYRALSFVYENSQLLTAYRYALKSELQPPTMFDAVDMSFIEYMSIDGFTVNQSIWTETGSLSQILYSHCNENVNELFFDLRPVTTDNNGDITVFGSNYDYSPDELGINVTGLPDSGFSAGIAGVHYVPAVIMREYPHSVVEGIDYGLGYFDTKLFGENVGFIPFGPIFSQSINPTEPIRAIYNYQNAGVASLVPEACLAEKGSLPLKHLDVVPIVDQDVINSSLGRSDDDTFNLFSLSASNSAEMAEMWKFTTNDFSPIINYISVARNGLRTREPSTTFANYSRDPRCVEQNAAQRSSAVDNHAVRRNLVRWQLLMDHWMQHNTEYLTGSIDLRGMPEIRIGYRIDWVDRHESYYVEQVGHDWQFPGAMTTSIQVSRGQRNDPLPCYVPPRILTPEDQTDEISGGDRSVNGRLAVFFQIKDTPATSNATQFGETKISSTDVNEIDQDNYEGKIVKADGSIDKKDNTPIITGPGNTIIEE